MAESPPAGNLLHAITSSAVQSDTPYIHIHPPTSTSLSPLLSLVTRATRIPPSQNIPSRLASLPSPAESPQSPVANPHGPPHSPMTVAGSLHRRPFCMFTYHNPQGQTTGARDEEQPREHTKSPCPNALAVSLRLLYPPPTTPSHHLPRRHHHRLQPLLP